MSNELLKMLAEALNGIDAKVFGIGEEGLTEIHLAKVNPQWGLYHIETGLPIAYGEMIADPDGELWEILGGDMADPLDQIAPEDSPHRGGVVKVRNQHEMEGYRSCCVFELEWRFNGWQEEDGTLHPPGEGKIL